MYPLDRYLKRYARCAMLAPDQAIPHQKPVSGGGSTEGKDKMTRLRSNVRALVRGPVESKSGDFTGSGGEKIPYAYRQVEVLDGDANKVTLRVHENVGGLELGSTYDFVIDTIMADAPNKRGQATIIAAEKLVPAKA